MVGDVVLKYIFANVIFLFQSIVWLILFSSCTKQNNTDCLVNDVKYVIDFEDCMRTKHAMKVSAIADTVEYLELKTPENISITRIWNIIPVDNFWIIHSRDGVYKFTDNGQFVMTIGRSGQGPGEYSVIYDIAVDYIRKEILINASGQFLFYDLDGKFLRMMKKDETLFRVGISDSILWICEAAMNTDKYLVYGMNYQRKIVDSIPNPYYGMESQDEGAGFHLAKLYKPFYLYKDTLYLKGKEVNDTIYQLSGTKCKPYIAINMGKYKLPAEYESWFSFDALQKNGSRYWGIPSVAEDNRYLFLLTQRYAPENGNKYVHNEENFRYIVYDKKLQMGSIMEGEKGTRLEDDILGGPPIWPYWVTDHYYMNVVEWYDLSEEIKNGNYSLSTAFKNQLEGWGSDTNPLVILCRKKSEI